MGMYTELILGCKFKEETPESVIKVLQAMVTGLDAMNELQEIPDHPFFKSDRWRILFSCSSYYFAVNQANREMWNDSGWRISTRSNIKNYDDEIEKFLDWIKPWIWGGRNFYAIVTYEEGEPVLFFLD